MIDPAKVPPDSRPLEPGATYDLDNWIVTLASGEVVPIETIGYDPTSDHKRGGVLAGPTEEGRWITFEFDERVIS